MMKETVLEKTTDFVCVTCAKSLPDAKVHLLQGNNRDHVVLRLTQSLEKIENA